MRCQLNMLAFLAALSMTGALGAQQVNVEEFVLDNGMKFLLVPRTDQPNVIAAGWLAKVGSVNERPGITGISHFFEHMMFKGTTTIGTRDPKADADFMARQKAVRDQINRLVWTEQYDRYAAGEIDDPWDPANDSPKLKDLRAQLKSLMDEHRSVIVKDEFDKVYTEHGGSGMNAFTSEDVTFYFITVPSNKFELWAWMESDRLNDSVFREFYAERDVVHEERRLRTESTPTGEFDEQFEAMFWQSSPYSWPVIGWPSDLNSYTLEEAMRYWDIYYRPNNLVGAIVGDFNPSEVKSLIEEYFGRLTRGEQEPPPVVTLEVPQKAEMRLYAECDCQPQVEVRYHTVPFGHADSYALEMMAAVLNGRTGRLYKSMVEGKEIASQAIARQDIRKYAGAFAFNAEVKGEAQPSDLEITWEEQLHRLQNELVPEQELQKVKNQQAANAYRRLQSNFSLMIQLAMAEANGDWRYINESPAKLQAVTAADIQRVAKTYFDRTNRCVATYIRKADSAPDDPELAQFDPQQQAMIKQVLSRLKTANDPRQLQLSVEQIESQRATVPEEFRPGIDYILKKFRERIAELEAAGAGKE
jgi:predicted Zn-dependent peptidase